MYLPPYEDVLSIWTGATFTPPNCPSGMRYYREWRGEMDSTHCWLPSPSDTDNVYHLEEKYQVHVQRTTTSIVIFTCSVCEWVAHKLIVCTKSIEAHYTYHRAHDKDSCNIHYEHLSLYLLTTFYNQVWQSSLWVSCVDFTECNTYYLPSTARSACSIRQAVRQPRLK